MLETIEGIIISEKSYSETSKLITLITKEHGVINLLAKGAKTLKSPLRSTTSKLTHGYFNIIYKESKLSTLKEVDIIEYYKNIKKDINKISYATYILELVEQVIKQTNNEEAFNILKEKIKKIEEGINPIVITNILELKCLNFLGSSTTHINSYILFRPPPIIYSNNALALSAKSHASSETLLSLPLENIIDLFNFTFLYFSR